MSTKLMYIPSLRTKITAIVALLAFSAALMIPAEASAQTTNNPLQSTSSVLVTGQTGAGAFFNGILKITSVAANTATGVLTASGTLTGTLTSRTGSVLGTVNQAVTNILITSASASCNILSLTLGPLDLNLLGLMVHLNQVVLTITAQPGPGNLLGNLLCDVANLLNGGSLSTLLNQLVSDLNGILNILNGVA
jgi:hypothetical protein